jgi:hypothetical protein
MIYAINMKQAALALALFVLASSGFALPVGACYPVADARTKLTAEGQKVAIKSSDGKIVVTSGSRGNGYMLQASSRGALCVSSALDDVSTIRVKGQHDSAARSNASARSSSAAAAAGIKANANIGGQGTVDICGNPQTYSGAVDVCTRLAQIPPVTRTISATAPRSVLSTGTVGPVSITFVVCRDKRGREELCGRTETAKNEPIEGRR